LGNVVAFDTSFREGELLRALNANSETVHFLAIANVSPTFSPRRALRRWYRYLLPDEGLDVELMSEGALLFEGRHDFRSFCKEEGRSTVRTVESVQLTKRSGMVVVDVKAREFLWNMVRRMVAALESVGAKEKSLREISRGLEGEQIQAGLAPPENLFLMEVEYRFPFNAECPSTLKRKLEENLQHLRVSEEFQSALLSFCGMEGCQRRIDFAEDSIRRF
jgi:tRNA pseudouridine38-40 synthase